MEKTQPPIRSIFPGRVFRNEAISARSHCIFHQIEGLYVDENVSFADLKQTLLQFAKELFGENTQIRLRPLASPPSGTAITAKQVRKERDIRVSPLSRASGAANGASIV